MVAREFQRYSLDNEWDLVRPENCEVFEIDGKGKSGCRRVV